MWQCSPAPSAFRITTCSCGAFSSAASLLACPLNTRSFSPSRIRAGDLILCMCSVVSVNCSLLRMYSGSFDVPYTHTPFCSAHRA